MNDKNNNSKKTKKKLITALTATAVALAVMLAAAAVYLGIHYSADKTALAALSGSSEVKAAEIDEGYFFDGSGSETALVFYPGAKVDSETYSPLMTRIAEKGVDCFLLKVPFRLALLNTNAAKNIIDRYSYDNWIVSGHSMGAVAASFCFSNKDSIDGLALLAGYPNNPIPDTVIMVSVSGDRDGVLNREAYEGSKKYWSSQSSEITLNGANHAGFGNYGKQDGDLDAQISSAEQQQQTALIISDLADRLSQAK